MTFALRVFVAMVVYAGLAAGTASDLSAQREPIRVRMPGNARWIWVDSVASAPASVPASPALTYKAAAAVLTELKVPLGVDEPHNGLLGNGGFTALRMLGRERLSRYLECGMGTLGAHADVRRITMALFVWVDSAGPALSRVSVAVVAGSNDNEGVSKNALTCGSTGALETFLTDEIRKRAVMP